MNGGHLANLMNKYGKRQKEVAQWVRLTVRTVQSWVSPANRAKLVPRDSAIALLRAFMGLELARIAVARGEEAQMIDDVLVDAILSLEVFENAEVSFTSANGDGKAQEVTFSEALRGTVTARKLNAESRSMLLEEILAQVERSNLDAGRFVRGVSEQNVIVVHVRKFLGARTCRLRLRDPKLTVERIDRAWLEKAVEELDVMEERLSNLRVGLRALLGG